ncbi:MAG: hypothetical protein B7Y95_23285 [Rhizobiales bacterium 32-66-11]|nr:MAG: hypothetical protein B7Y95_23285 [Rhizobiales bacterium 32-66-11]
MVQTGMNLDASRAGVVPTLTRPPERRPITITSGGSHIALEGGIAAGGLGIEGITSERAIQPFARPQAKVLRLVVHPIGEHRLGRDEDARLIFRIVEQQPVRPPAFQVTVIQRAGGEAGGLFQPLEGERTEQRRHLF